MAATPPASEVLRNRIRHRTDLEAYFTHDGLSHHCVAVLSIMDVHSSGIVLHDFLDARSQGLDFIVTPLEEELVVTFQRCSLPRRRTTNFCHTLVILRDSPMRAPMAMDAPPRVGWLRDCDAARFYCHWP